MAQVNKAIIIIMNMIIKVLYFGNCVHELPLATLDQKLEFLKYSGEYRAIPPQLFSGFPGIPILIRRIPWQ
jgi:hypothetical protein